MKNFAKETNGSLEDYELLSLCEFQYRDDEAVKTYRYARGIIEVTTFSNGVTCLYNANTGVNVVYRKGARTLAFSQANHLAQKAWAIGI